MNYQILSMKIGFSRGGLYLLSSHCGCLFLFEPWASHAILIKISNITVLHQRCASLLLNFVFLLFRILLLPLFLRDKLFKTCYSALHLGYVFLCYSKVYLIFLNHYCIILSSFVLMSVVTSKPVTLI